MTRFSIQQKQDFCHKIIFQLTWKQMLALLKPNFSVRKHISTPHFAAEASFLSMQARFSCLQNKRLYILGILFVRLKQMLVESEANCLIFGNKFCLCPKQNKLLYLPEKYISWKHISHEVEANSNPIGCNVMLNRVSLKMNIKMEN